MTALRNCQHPRARHQHGTYLAHDKDGCRCEPCVIAARRQSKRVGYRTATGTHSYVPADQARAHVTELLHTLTISQIEQRSGVHRTAIRVLIGDYPGRPASKRITRRTHRAILDVTPDRVGPESSGLVDRAGTRRRLQALAAIGYPISHIANTLGIGHKTAWLLASDTETALVTCRVRDAVRRIYDQLSMTPPQRTPNALRIKTNAAKRGWLPPLAWDDETIDDPHTQPRRGDATTRPRKVEIILELVNELGILNVHDIARTLNTNPVALEQILTRAGRRDIWHRLTNTAAA